MERKLGNPNLNDFLPDSQVQDDISNILWNQPSMESVENQLPAGTVEIDDGYVNIPNSAQLDIIAKSYRQNNYKGGFGNHYAVLVAIGGVVNISSGIPMPKYCYATLFYSSEKRFITLDFHAEMR